MLFNGHATCVGWPFLFPARCPFHSVYSVRDGRKIRKTFRTLADAKGWRVDSLHALARGRLRAPATTVAAEAAALLAALAPFEGCLWATAMYAGLRRGELRALAWSDVDLKARVIHVARG